MSALILGLRSYANGKDKRPHGFFLFLGLPVGGGAFRLIFMRPRQCKIVAKLRNRLHTGLTGFVQKITSGVVTVSPLGR